MSNARIEARDAFRGEKIDLLRGTRRPTSRDRAPFTARGYTFFDVSDQGLPEVIAGNTKAFKPGSWDTVNRAVRRGDFEHTLSKEGLVVALKLGTLWVPGSLNARDRKIPDLIRRREAAIRRDIDGTARLAVLPAASIAELDAQYEEGGLIPRQHAVVSLDIRSSGFARRQRPYVVGRQGHDSPLDIEPQSGRFKTGVLEAVVFLRPQ